MYQDLKKIHHRNESKALSVYEARLHDGSAVTLDIAGTQFFYWLPPDVYSRLLDVERMDRSVNDLARSMPQSAIDRYISECMIDEIILTNEIEGVPSTRKEVELALESLKKHDKRRRFQGIVNKYSALFLEEETPLRTPKDVRALYDDLVLEEVVGAQPRNEPDGKLFRAGAVSVANAAQRIIHESVLSEKQITEEMAKGLALFNDEGVEPLVRAALFHFIFAFIHPFYDGNGRMNRFISSQLVSREASRWAGLRLSFSVKENIRDYYKAFRLVEHPLNRGDLTPFIITFLEIALDALEKTNDALWEKNLLLQNIQEQLHNKYGADTLMDVDGVGRALLEAALFTGRGLTTDKIAAEAGISVPTAHKRLKRYKSVGLLERERFGRSIYYRLALDAAAK